MKKSRLLLMVFLILPLAFLGCEGDDGAQGPAGPPGPPGTTGPPGAGAALQANEACFLCHSDGQPFNVSDMHRLDTDTGDRIPVGTMTVDNIAVAFGAPVGDNVPITVNFNFAATNQAGNDITDQIDLRTATASGLSFLRLTVAQLREGAIPQDSDDWHVFTHRPGQSGSGPYFENRITGGGAITGDPATGAYTYTFPDNSVRVSDGYQDNVVTRMIVEVRSVPFTLFTDDPFYNTNFRRPVVDAFFDSVPDGSPLAGLPVKNSVSTAACNSCHDPLAIHGGSRREYKYCQACHNPTLEAAFDNTNLVNLVHKIHTSQVVNIVEDWDFTELTYPQDIRNCTTCHQGPDADNTYDNWMNVPTITSCGSCHINVNFATGAGHVGGAQTTNAGCSLSSCHPPAAIVAAHATENATPNNLQLPGTLVSFKYGINEVTVDDNNVATIRFFIQQDDNNDGAFEFVNLGDNVITRPAGFSGGPSFLFAYALPQDGVTIPEDYNNLGRAAGQPESLSIIGLPIIAFNPDFSEYTVQRADAFPVGAQMRAVALQGYFTQISGGTGLDNVGRHTFSVMQPVTGDRVRRVAVESGYTDNNNPFTGEPIGCLQCHEIFEGHGGNRVSNAQVCVMCHNPNLSSGGRTITADPINPDIVAYFTNDGDPTTMPTDPLTYPEVSNNFKELIHALHGAQKRTTDFVDIRNRLNGVIITSDEITFPGDLSHCGKCHLNDLYEQVQTTGRFLSTVVTTTGADNSAADVTAARASVPNATDLVNTPATSACGHCHDSDTARSHFITQGGAIRQMRGSGVSTIPPLGVK